MNDLIDRKQLLSIFHNKAFDKANTDIPYRELLWAINVIKQAPSAEKTGKWIQNDNGTYSCSLCQSWIPNEQHHYARYCLHCGARMVD